MEATSTRKNSNSNSNSNSDSIAASLAPVVERVAAGAHEAVDKAATAANSAAKTLSQKGDEFSALQARYLDGCRDQVKANPLVAVGAALAAGFLISLLLSRR
jgi:ElaB/YqjD/DUF883 family membrane-anchored ribosome-binding protein